MAKIAGVVFMVVWCSSKFSGVREWRACWLSGGIFTADAAWFKVVSLVYFKIESK